MGFLTALLGLLAKLGLDFWTHRGPTPIVTEAERVGAETQSASNAQQAVKVETAVAQAEAEAPTTKAEIERSLKDGSF